MHVTLPNTQQCLGVEVTEVSRGLSESFYVPPSALRLFVFTSFPLFFLLFSSRFLRHCRGLHLLAYITWSSSRITLHNSSSNSTITLTPSNHTTEPNLLYVDRLFHYSNTLPLHPLHQYAFSIIHQLFSSHGRLGQHSCLWPLLPR